MEYIAHIKGERKQTVEQHNIGVANMTFGFGKAFGFPQTAKQAALLHDIGKFSEDFQRRILHGGKKCDHATAGAFEAYKRGDRLGAFAIMGHHGSLPDMGSKIDGATSSTFIGRIKRAQSGNIPNYSSWQGKTVLSQRLALEQIPSDINAQNIYFLVKLLHSSLVDADYLDTESFCSPDIKRSNGEPIAVLSQKLDGWLKNKGWLEGTLGINGARTAILKAAGAAGSSLQRGAYTLTVPTGAGKTISALSFALKHAASHGMERIIYIAPYLNIIEQTAAQFKEILGVQNVLEHHSEAVIFNSTQSSDQAVYNPYTQTMRFASENWEIPIVVTTAVQFYESLFASRPAKCRKVHNIANSVIIYDEAQMIPVYNWTPIMKIMDAINTVGNSTQLFCTATQPGIEFDGAKKPKEIVPDIGAFKKFFKRVTFNNAGVQTKEELTELIASKSQVLCIVNTKRAAKELFDMLPEKDFAYHLSTMMVPAHRHAVLRNIKERLNEGSSCRVIATSLVEAGVDLDFSSVLRELAGLDSILQAAGRCNRNGLYKASESIVGVFELPDAAHPGLSTQISAAKHVMQKFSEWDGQDAISEYFKVWRGLKDKSNLDKYGVISNMEKFAFRSIDKNFRMIDSELFTIYVPYDDNAAALINRLNNKEYSRELFRELGRYGVGVYSGQFYDYINGGAAYLPYKDANCAVLTSMETYDNHTGLPFNAETGAALFL